MKFIYLRRTICILFCLAFFSSAQAEVFDGLGGGFKHPPKNSGAAAPAKTPMRAPTGPAQQGKVIEMTSGSGYSYLLLNAGGQEYWIAGTQVSAKVGDVVSYVENVTMVNFTSKTLNKTFDKIVFASSVKVVP